MALPDLIEIVPLTQPVRAEITVPGSKSITNRALILAALAEGEVTLRGALWSEDTEIMFECLHKLGFEISQQLDPDEPCNRTITVKGLGGRVPAGGTESQPLDLFVGNAGTAARFLAPFLCLGSGVYRLHGVPRMHERPQAALFVVLRELGYRVDSENGNDKLPVRIFGASPKPGKCRVSIEKSSQFASALLLSAGIGQWQVEIIGENADESPYVVMTSKLMEAFPKTGGTFQIEPDASSGSYFWAANWLVSAGHWMKEFLETTPPAEIQKRFHTLWEWVQAEHRPGTINPVHENQLAITVRNWPDSGWQIDADFPNFIPLPKSISREGQLGDSIMTAIIVAADLWGGFGLESRAKGIHFHDLQRLRLQECERVVALRTELIKCGATVVEHKETLMVYQAKLHGAEIETYNDHRMAMCFAILGLKVPGIKIKNPACVKKTFPNFFQKLAAPAPHGLGAEILDAKSVRKLTHEELFAD